MAILAESFVLRLELPYSEYWLPLAIGMGVGFLALIVSKLAFVSKRNVPAPVQKPEPTQRDPFTEGSTTEQRKSVRRQGNPTAVHVALPHNKKDPAQGWVLDRSTGGLCLQASQEYAPGTQLAVLPVIPTPGVSVIERQNASAPFGCLLETPEKRLPAFLDLGTLGVRQVQPAQPFDLVFHLVRREVADRRKVVPWRQRHRRPLIGQGRVELEGVQHTPLPLDGRQRLPKDSTQAFQAIAVLVSLLRLTDRALDEFRGSLLLGDLRIFPAVEEVLVATAHHRPEELCRWVQFR